VLPLLSRTLITMNTNISSIFIALVLTVTPSLAWAGESALPNAPGFKKRGKSAAQVEMESYFHKIDKPVSMPDVPEVAGHAKFRFGLEHTDKNGLTSVGLRYGTCSSPQQLIDFYKQGLIAQQWKLSSASSTGLRAQKGDRRLTVNVMPKGSPDVATDFMVNYCYRGH